MDGDEPPTEVFRVTPDLPATDPSIDTRGEKFGPYVIYEKLGSGGMAIVHRAETRGLAGFRREVALKRMLPHLADDAAFVRSFTHEAKLASRLTHANIAQAYDLGKIDDTYYIAMEYVRGPTLTQVMQQCVAAAGAMPLPLAIAILTQLCEALDYAHNLAGDDGHPLNIVHRDVSPGNVIVSTTGTVKLIDFGIAKAKSSKEPTRAGVVKGKFAYIAPEYVAAGEVDARGDLFGLGVIAHEMLTNRRLFQDKTDVDTVRNVLEMPVQPPSRWVPDIPFELDNIVMVALQRDRTQRWQNASAMAAALRGVAKDLGAIVMPQHIVAYLTTAFAAKPRAEDSALEKMIESDALEPSISIEAEMIIPDIKTSPGVHAPAPGPRTTMRVSTPLPPPGEELPRRWPLVIVVLLLLGGAGFAVAYFGLIPT